MRKANEPPWSASLLAPISEIDDRGEKTGLRNVKTFPTFDPDEFMNQIGMSFGYVHVLLAIAFLRLTFEV